jgi:alpha-methylacyl-CoA racemase
MRVLNGIRVVSIAVNLPGPLVALKLNELGAGVLKVEPPNGDPIKMGSATYYRKLLGHQKVTTLNLKDAADRAKLLHELESAHLFITSSRPVSLERMGLDWNTLHKSHPHLCMLSIVGYAAPNENKVGHDLTYQASRGLLTPPELPKTCLADIAGSQEGVIQALGLLFEHERSGNSGYAEVALAESLNTFLEPWEFGLTQPGGILGGGHPGYRIYATQDGWVALAALEPQFQLALAKELNLKNSDADEIERAFKQKTSDEWQRLADEKDLPIQKID